MKKNKGEDTKRLIREAAYKLFLIKGYNTSSLKELERSVHVARGSLYYHYPNKQELFIDVIDHYLLRSRMVDYRVTNSNEPLWNFIADYIQNIQAIIDEMKQLLFPSTQTDIIRGYIHLVFQAERYYPEFSTHINQITLNEIQSWESVLCHAKEKGEIKSSCNLPLLARLLRNIFFGILYQDSLACEQNLIEKLREAYHFQYRLIREQ